MASRAGSLAARRAGNVPPRRASSPAPAVTPTRTATGTSGLTPGSPSLRIPVRDQLVTLVVEALPRLSPFRLTDAPLAYERARLATTRALDTPVQAVVRCPS